MIFDLRHSGLVLLREEARLDHGDAPILAAQVF